MQRWFIAEPSYTFQIYVLSNTKLIARICIIVTVTKKLKSVLSVINSYFFYKFEIIAY